MFGEFIKQKRLEKRLSLRAFCRLLHEDASNWSKVERGKLSPPKDEQKLGEIACILDIEKDSTDWNTLIDAAFVEAGKIPQYLMSDKEVIQELPVFFRTIGSIKPTRKELRALIEKIRKEG
jgi:transcriptional regulator with XRE-family HTH domain